MGDFTDAMRILYPPIPWNKGKRHSPAARRKMKATALKRVRNENKKWSKPNKGKNEKRILDRIELKNGIKIDRNYMVWGFYPDGYCHQTNTIYEVYEKYHARQVFEDLRREDLICKALGCDFIIIWDK